MQRKGRFRMYWCSFCEKDQNQVGRLIAGPGVYICDGCTSVFRARFAGSQTDEGRRCSFCGKREQSVQYVISKSGTETCICNECLDLCHEIIREEQATKRNPEEQ